MKNGRSCGVILRRLNELAATSASFAAFFATVSFVVSNHFFGSHFAELKYNFVIK
jgi:hypothetical protein